MKVKTGFGRSTILCPCLYKERGQR
ncbi:hypothetical protein L2746_16745 [Shewanella psychromarinicola]|nr:hypothetical protein [Shewanella livingstonensis]MCL1083588.1 hypothetical protein [Shewanella psychromarinicola]